MGQEIERKFLVVTDDWRASSRSPQRVRQGYLARTSDIVVRVRTIGARSFLTIKSVNPGRVRDEFEYEIPTHEAEHLMTHQCAGDLIEKTRHRIEWSGLDWVIDVFDGRHAGLVMAEIELHGADQKIAVPPWAGAEVTDDPRYRNERLASQDTTPKRGTTQ